MILSKEQKKSKQRFRRWSEIFRSLRRSLDDCATIQKIHDILTHYSCPVKTRFLHNLIFSPHPIVTIDLLHLYLMAAFLSNTIYCYLMLVPALFYLTAAIFAFVIDLSNKF